MTAVDPRIAPTMIQIVRWLVDRNYSAIERYTQGVRYSAEMLKQAVQDYGQTLVMPPDSAFSQLEIGEITDSNPRAWWVVAGLWTAEAGQSDLSLECEMIDRPGDMLAVEVDGLHVL
jgi:hypothetical protein